MLLAGLPVIVGLFSANIEDTLALPGLKPKQG